MKLYSVFDKVSKVFQFPCAVENDETAIRGFAGLADSYKFFPDLELYCVGSFDMETGLITPIEVVPAFVCSASQFSVVKDGDTDEV